MTQRMLALGFLLMLSGAAHADGPQPSNGWRWMMNEVSGGPSCSGGA